MKLKDMNKEELELLSYTDLTEMILKETKHSMTTPQIFKQICDMLELTEEDYTNKIGDYYTSLTTDKRFVLLDNAEWDLRINHKVEIVVDDEDDEEEIEDEDSDSTDEEELKDSIDEENNDDDLDEDDDDMEDLSIVDDDTEEE